MDANTSVCDLPCRFSASKPGTDHNYGSSSQVNSAISLNPIDRLISNSERGSGLTALQHQLQLANSCTTDVESCPAQCQQDGCCDDDQPKVHGSEGWLGDPKDW